jgi:hypothetical protein
VKEQADSRNRPPSTLVFPGGIGRVNRAYDPEYWNQNMVPTTARVAAQLKSRGFTCLSAVEGRELMQTDAAQLSALSRFWARLPPDKYLRDGGHYRFRRHSCFIQDHRSGELAPVPHRAHWQSIQYNALHGGITRLFEPIDDQVSTSAPWSRLLCAIGNLFARVQTVERWFIEAHQFRIDTVEGIGRPTPEGAHRDGVDFVAVILMRRHGVRGGETTVREPDGLNARRYTLQDPGSMLLLDDARVIHETSAIHPTGPSGVRDTLVLTYRGDGFQGSPSLMSRT